MYKGLIAFLTLNGALVGAFGLLFTPLYWGAIPVPLGIVVSMLTLPWLIRAAGELDPRPLAAGAPLAAWALVVLVLAFAGPGADVLLPATWQSLLLVLGGLGVGLWSLQSVLLDEGAHGSVPASPAARPAPSPHAPKEVPHG